MAIASHEFQDSTAGKVRSYLQSQSVIFKLFQHGGSENKINPIADEVRANWRVKTRSHVDWEDAKRSRVTVLDLLMDGI